MTPYYEHGGIAIYHGDCREILPTLDKVDLVLTDPPYGLNEKWGDSKPGWVSKKINGCGKLWHGTPEWDRSTSEVIVAEAISKADRAIIWGGNYYPLPPTNSWLIWDKMQKHTGSEAELAWSNLDQPVRVFRMSRVEAFQVNDLSSLGKQRGKERKYHPNQKPFLLMRWCLSFSHAETVLDPFMGSGTTLRAAKDLGRQAIGIEIEEKYCEIAANRLAQEVLF